MASALAMWFKTAEAERRGPLGSAAVRLLQDSRARVTGVVLQDAEGFRELTARAVVLGCGGFEANPAWRARYLGRPWDHAKVRGTRYNTGDGLRMALEIGALPHGQWTGCHSTPIDAMRAPGDASGRTRPPALVSSACSSKRAAVASSTREDSSSHLRQDGRNPQPAGARPLFDAKAPACRAVQTDADRRRSMKAPLIARRRRGTRSGLGRVNARCMGAPRSDGQDAYRHGGIELPKSNWARGSTRQPSSPTR